MTRLLPLAPFAAVAGGLLVATFPAPAQATEAARPFAAQYDRESRARALRCLTEAIYYEARSETEDGQRAVAQVVLNRVRHPSYPASVCGVVYQGSHRRTGCQFSFTCDGSMARGVTESSAWDRAQRVAQAALGGYVHRPAGLALNYHTTAIRPYWAPSLVRHAVIGAHIFYRHPASGSVAAFDQAPARAEPSPGTSVNFVARASRTAAAPQRRTSSFRPSRVEAAIMERVQIERVQIERPAFQHPSGRVSRPSRATVAAPRASAQPRATSSRRGPSVTIQNGVRVARGS